MPIYVDVISRLDERAAAATAREIDRQFNQAGVTAGRSAGTALTDAIDRATRTTGAGLTTRFSDHGTQAGRSFGASFDASVSRALPASGGFSSAVNGYSGAATRAGTAAGRALGTAFTVAAGGLIGAASLTIFKGFERYQAIDAAKNRLENLNRTLQATGRAGLDVGAVMNTVTKAVTDTPFALDQAFSVATRALASNTGDLQRFMTVVTDAAGFAGAGVDEIGEAFLKVANTGKVSMEEIGNELRNIPILPWLQQQLGVTGGELQKMISDGKVGLEDLMKAVEANASGFAKASGDTIAGAMQNMQTAVARIGANLLGAVFGKPTEDGNDLVEVLKTVRARLDDVNAWITAHQGDIRKAFQEAAQVAKDLGGAISDIIGFLERMGIGVDDVARAFIVWKAIDGVVSLTTSLDSISKILGVGLPDAATKGAGGITAALAKVNVPTWLTFLTKWGGALGVGLQSDVKNPTELGLPEVKYDSQGRPYLPGTAYDPNTGTLPQAVDPTGGLLTGGNGPFLPGSLGGPAGAQADRHGNRQDPTAPAGNPILPPPGAGGGDGKLPKAPVVPYDTSLPPGIPGMPADASVFAAESSFLDARHTLAEKQARLNQLLQTNTATEEDILNARNEVAAEVRDFQAAEMRMNDARQTQYKQMTKQLTGAANDLSELGAAIDKDFGISKGLGGIVENFVKAAGNILAAPFLRALGLIEKANPNEGSGLVGILAANGAFGSQYTPGAIAAAKSNGSVVGYPYGAPAGGPMPGAALPGESAKDFAHRVMMPFWQSQGLTVGDHAADQFGEHQNGALDIMVPDIATGQKVLQQVLQDPNVYGAIFDNQTYGYGHGLTPQDYTAGHTGNPTQDHQDHVHAWYKPGGQDNISPLTGGPASSGPVPVTVVSAPGMPSQGLSPDQWNAIAGAEASGNWSANTGNGFSGGLQFAPSTWTGFGGGQYAPEAWQATPQQQMAIGDRVLAAQGPGAWPATSAAHPEWFQPQPYSSGWGPGPLAPPSPGTVPTGGGTMAPGMPQGLGIYGAGPGVGGAAAASSPTMGGGLAYPSQGGNSGNAIGGLPLDAAMGAASALDAMMPGAGAAAKIGIQLANRTIGYAAQNAGIAASGLMETLSIGDNPKGSLGAGWIGKIVGGLAGAAPALPNIAGGQKAPLPPGQGQPGNNMNNVGNTTINVATQPGADGDKIGSSVAEHQYAMSAPSGRQG